ncbi:MAG: bifunctional glutamate N-acetyltransferase/amino-acid acetyltransferase ArgJ [Rhodospirillales bacterium]|nr:bifunctional glutamate N-acetyltransferase/amino-acid acetyltransferase ArgJ [Rhodospirillales bacterium]
MSGEVSPLAPASLPSLPPIAGVRLAATAAGIRYAGRDDLMLAELAPGTAVAGVFTRNKCPGAPVDWCRKVLPGGRARALVVNSGNSNVFTGRAGREVVERTAAETARLIGCAPEEVFISSTGVIGEPPPAERIIDALPAAKAALAPDNWMRAARAIMTTDTFPKLATASVELGGRRVILNAFCKGSGMIAPDMATMLAYLFTDAAIEPAALQAMLVKANELSFNCVTVDGDTSTSDTVLLFATGAAGNAPLTRPDPAFERALETVMVDLAQQLARDGEGAEKFVTIRVTGAESDAAARRIGLSVGNSPLVKTAIAAGDANWGRIVMAVGKAGEAADRDRLSVRVGGTLIAEKGGPVPGYDETPVAAHMAGREVLIEIDIGIGQGKATVWTCDLTHRYVDINGSYRS